MVTKSNPSIEHALRFLNDCLNFETFRDKNYFTTDRLAIKFVQRHGIEEKFHELKEFVEENNLQSAFDEKYVDALSKVRDALWKEIL